MAPSFADKLEEHKQEVGQTLPILRCPGPCVHWLETTDASLTAACHSCLADSSLPDPWMPFGAGLRVWASHFL